MRRVVKGSDEESDEGSVFGVVENEMDAEANGDDEKALLLDEVDSGDNENGEEFGILVRDWGILSFPFSSPPISHHPLVEPPHWNFVLFYKYSRKEQWAVDDRGIKWVVSRFYRYDNIRGPEGLPERLFNKQLRAKQKQLKNELALELLSKFCAEGEEYDYSYIVGDHPCATDLAKAQKVRLGRLTVSLFILSFRFLYSIAFL